MTSPEQPDTPPLTRKQLREIRNTGATPVITAGAVPFVAPPAEQAEGVEQSEAEQPDAPVADEQPDAPVADEQPPEAPLPRPAAPSVVGAAPIADASVDLGVSPLTRRQARQQERIRTASVPVITPDVAAAHAAATAGAAPRIFAPEPTSPTDEPTESTDEPAVWAPEPISVVPGRDDDETQASDDHVVAVLEDDDLDDAVDEEDRVPEDESDRAVVSPKLGAAVIAGEPVEIDLPPSFDQLLAQGSTGSIGTPNALILSQGAADMPMISPVNATGEIIITGTFNLPEGLGSTGHALGTADGKETDAVLVDGELPAHSSPTPIAASAAISTVKGAGDVIRPPAPEKGSRLMLWLAITAGALALALVGVLVLAFTTGVL
ncbi:hypothetical protein QL996_00695 [Planococcus sp. APC 4015]|nr:hypothetical protein [Planococcus sp. APC 4015]